jgi:hypothetical protein
MLPKEREVNENVSIGYVGDLRCLKSGEVKRVRRRCSVKAQVNFSS